MNPKYPEDPNNGAFQPTLDVDPFIVESARQIFQLISNSVASANQPQSPNPFNADHHLTPEVKAEPMPQAIKKVHAVFYAFITASVLLLKASELTQTSEDYHPLLNYGRVKFMKINAGATQLLDIMLVILGLLYGACQVVAQLYRVKGKHMYDFISIYVGGILVCSLMAGVSGPCGIIVGISMFALLSLLNAFKNRL